METKKAKKSVACSRQKRNYAFEMSAISVEIPLSRFPEPVVLWMRKEAVRLGITIDEVIARLTLETAERVVSPEKPSTP